MKKTLTNSGSLGLLLLEDLTALAAGGSVCAILWLVDTLTFMYIRSVGNVAFALNFLLKIRVGAITNVFYR